MKVVALTAITTLLMTLSACDPSPPGSSLPSTAMQLTYVSGHLGIYADCPDDAFTGSGAKADFARAAAMAPCPPDEENCQNFFMNCESAEVTIRIKNTGTSTLDGVNVAELQLLTAQESILHSLPIVAVDVPPELTDGLSPGEEVVVRVEFQGPASNWEMISHPIHILVIDADNKGSEITTPPLDSLPMMVS